MNGGDVIRDEFFTTSSSPLPPSVCNSSAASPPRWKQEGCSGVRESILRMKLAFSILSWMDKSFSGEWNEILFYL